jgi:hypothetical protein
MRWINDGRYLYLARSGNPYEVFRYEIATARLEPWAQIRPSNVAAVTGVVIPHITPDGRHIAYTYLHALYSEVALIQGLERRLSGAR